MDANFQRLLGEAEEIRKGRRGTGSPGNHGAKMAELIKYGRGQGLIKKGDGVNAIMEGKVSEEHLSLGAEMAAMVIEMASGEQVASVLSLSADEKRQLIARA